VLKNPLTVYKNLLQIANTIEKVNKDKVALNKAIFSLKNRCVYRIVYGIIKNINLKQRTITLEDIKGLLD
jgi:hypothetical protein